MRTGYKATAQGAGIKLSSFHRFMLLQYELRVSELHGLAVTLNSYPSQLIGVEMALVPIVVNGVKPKDIRSHVAGKLRKLLEDHNLSQKGLAEKTGLTRYVIDELVRERREMKVFELYVISCYFKLDMEYFLPWECFDG